MSVCLSIYPSITLSFSPNPPSYLGKDKGYINTLLVPPSSLGHKTTHFFFPQFVNFREKEWVGERERERGR